jgi:hypothetical protein
MHRFLSTMEGGHGSVARQTEVPRTKLVNTLAQETQITSTVDFGDAISPRVTLKT